MRHGKPLEDYYVPEPNSGCWLWLGAILPNGKRKRNGGYGIHTVKVGKKTKTYRAHRFVWELKKGSLPIGLTLDHLCRVRCCVNPDHLEVVTNAENSRRGNGTKLSRNDVEAIRKEYVPFHRERSGAALARKYGVSSSEINFIVTGKRWVLEEDQA